MSYVSMKSIKLPEAPKPTLPAHRKKKMVVTPEMKRIEVPSVYNPHPAPRPKQMTIQGVEDEELIEEQDRDDLVADLESRAI